MTFRPKKNIPVKSNRQRREELDAKRVAKRTKAAKEIAASARATAIKNKVLVNPALLNPHMSPFNKPGFVNLGYYVDRPYSCRECGTEGVWTATQQKWWYEVAKGNVWTSETRCLACRRRLREQRAKEQRLQLERTARNAARVRLPKSSQRKKAIVKAT